MNALVLDIRGDTAATRMHKWVYLGCTSGDHDDWGRYQEEYRNSTKKSVPPAAA